MVAFKDRVEDGKTLEKRLRDEILEPCYLLEPRFAKTRREGRKDNAVLRENAQFFLLQPTTVLAPESPAFFMGIGYVGARAGCASLEEQQFLQAPR